MDNVTSPPTVAEPKPGSHPLRVLLVEDSPSDAVLAKQYLKSAGTGAFEITAVETLAEALAVAGQAELDAVLLDLGLPDSQGLGTFRALHDIVPSVPVIVLTGHGDTEAALLALRAGAADYLPKQDVSAPLLSRAVRYAVERVRMLRELDETRRREQEAREMAALAGIAAPSQVSVTARSFGVVPLQKAVPDSFDKLVGLLGEALDMSLERAMYRVDLDPLGPIRAASEELGRLRAVPRDVVDIYTTAVRERAQSAPPAKARAYLEEGRLLALQLMGHLVLYYRNYRPSGTNGTPRAPKPKHGMADT